MWSCDVTHPAGHHNTHVINISEKQNIVILFIDSFGRWNTKHIHKKTIRGRGNKKLIALLAQQGCVSLWEVTLKDKVLFRNGRPGGAQPSLKKNPTACNAEQTAHKRETGRPCSLEISKICSLSPQSTFRLVGQTLMLPLGPWGCRAGPLFSWQKPHCFSWIRGLPT